MEDPTKMSSSKVNYLMNLYNRPRSFSLNDYLNTTPDEQVKFTNYLLGLYNRPRSLSLYVPEIELRITKMKNVFTYSLYN